MGLPREEEPGPSHTSSPQSGPLPYTSASNTPQRARLKLPHISQFSIACYAGFISLAALYVAHSSANTSADAAILANKIATAGLSQAQVANQIQLLQLCLLNSTLLTDACEGVLAPAASQVPNIAALTTFQYGSGTANDQIEARFKRELMGFHIAFFSLLAFALIHIVFSLWRPVKEYMRLSRSLGSHSGGELQRRESKDGFVDHNGAGDPWPAATDHGGEWQTGSLQMAHMEIGVPFSPGAGVDPKVASTRRHISSVK